jgi:hypothetical protein
MEIKNKKPKPWTVTSLPEPWNSIILIAAGYSFAELFIYIFKF